MTALTNNIKHTFGHTHTQIPCCHAHINTTETLFLFRKWGNQGQNHTEATERNKNKKLVCILIGRELQLSLFVLHSHPDSLCFLFGWLVWGVAILIPIRLVCVLIKDTVTSLIQSKVEKSDTAKPREYFFSLICFLFLFYVIKLWLFIKWIYIE